MRFSVLLQIPHKNITLFTFQKPAVPPFCKWRDCWFPEEENAHEDPFSRVRGSRYDAPTVCQRAKTDPVGRADLEFRTKELFSLRKKRSGGIRLSAWQKAGSLYRLNPNPFRP